MKLLIAYFPGAAIRNRLQKCLPSKQGGGFSGLKEIRLAAQITRHVPKSKARLTQKRSCGLPWSSLSRTYAHLTRFSLLFRYGTTPIPASSVPSFLRILTGWENPFTSSRTHWMKTPASFPIRWKKRKKMPKMQKSVPAFTTRNWRTSTNGSPRRISSNPWSPSKEEQKGLISFL